LPVDLTQAIRARQTSNPKTVLAFYGTVLAILTAGGAGMIAALAETHQATFLIPWIAGFVGAVIVLVLIGVFVLTLFDPSALMLGQVSASDYAALHRIRLGDSDIGERESTLLVPAEIAAVPKLVAPEQPGEIE
jgi:hypothetical protein